MKRIVAVISIIAALLFVVPAAPADAHPRGYCGHLIEETGWWAIDYQYAYTYQGRHVHVNHHKDWWGFRYRYTTHIFCDGWH